MPSFPHPRNGTVLHDGGFPFRFTVFAGERESEWARMLASNPWRCIELELAASTHTDARAFLAQARDFFAASEQAGSTARPLLLYYGFLNLAKTLIKVRNPALDLGNAFHGVHENSANRQAQRFRLTSQSIDIEHPRPNKVHVLHELAVALGWPKPAAGKSYAVCDLLAQVPTIHRAFSHSRQKTERLHLVEHAEFVFDQASRELWAKIWIKPVGGNKPSALRSLKSRGYFKSIFTQVENDRESSALPAFQSAAVHYAQNPRSGLHELGQLCVKAGMTAILTSDGYRYYFADTQPSFRLHQSLAAYLAMFYFGSVARYRPSDLEKTLHGRFAWPIEEFFAAEGRQLLYMITNSILNREVVRPLALS